MCSSVDTKLLNTCHDVITHVNKYRFLEYFVKNMLVQPFGDSLYIVY